MPAPKTKLAAVVHPPMVLVNGIVYNHKKRNIPVYKIGNEFFATMPGIKIKLDGKVVLDAVAKKARKTVAVITAAPATPAPAPAPEAPATPAP